MSFVKFQKSARARLAVQIVLWGIVVVFVIGAFWSFGRPMPVGQEQPDRPVFAVNGQVVRAAQLWGTFEQYRSYFGSGPDAYFSTLYAATSQIVRGAVVQGEAKQRRITASSAEVEEKRTEFVDQQIKRAGEGPDRNRFLVEQDLTWKEYETRVARDAKARTAEFRAQICEDKLRTALTSDITVSDAELLARYRTFEVRHILIKVPSERERDAWLEQNPGAESAVESSESASTESGADSAAKKPAWFDRTEEQALAKAQELRTRLEDPNESFALLAKDNSDDTYSAMEGGSLGKLDYQGLQGMVPEFREAVVALEAGTVSQPVKSEFGYHLIKVETVEEKDVPKDFEQTKDKLRETELKTKQQRAYGERIQDLVESANIQFEDPEAEIAWLRGNRAGERTKSEETVSRQRALQLLQEVIEKKTREMESRAALTPDEPVSKEGLSQYYYEIGAIYKEQKLWGDALQAFRLSAESSPTWESQLEVGRCLVELNRGAEAIDLLKSVSEDTPGPRYAKVHQELLSLFSRAGDEKSATKELELLQQAQQANPYGGMGGPGGMPLNVQ